MSNKTISGVSKGVFQKLKDKIGALDKAVKLKRMEPYARWINEEISKYNTDADKRTMMFKLLRNPVEGTTTREKHTENVKDIAGDIADSFDWINSDITRVIAKHHDIGHTFLGHSGEWWLSSIKDIYGMPNYAHNAIGARNLVYRNDIFSDVEKRIAKEVPNISPKKLKKIKRDLWLVIDGINCHNGEKSEYSYEPDFSKNEKRFYDEIMGCYSKKGFDRTLVPATAEGSLMRLCDKISYIPFDLVDTFRNGCNVESLEINGEKYNVYEEYRKQFHALGMAEDSLEKLLACKTEEEYDNFAYDMQRILIEDVKKSTKRYNVRMSAEKSKAMHSIRDINNKLMVNYVVLKEDHDKYVPAMEDLMHKYSDIVLDNGLINPVYIDKSPVREMSSNPNLCVKLQNTYEHEPYAKGFTEYISKTRPEDFDFTVEACKKAFSETIDEELRVARIVASGDVDEDVEVKAEGDKKERIDAYILLFKDSLEKAYEEKLFPEHATNMIDKFRKKVWLDKTQKRIKNNVLKFDKNIPEGAGVTLFPRMVGMEMGAQYLASLNDYQWRDLLVNSKYINEEELVSLTRHYSDFDFRKEAKAHKAWDNISAIQAKETAQTQKNEKGLSFFQKARRIFSHDKER